MSVVGHLHIRCDAPDLLCSGNETEHTLTQLYSSLLLSQCAKRESVLSRLPPNVHHIVECRSERQNAAMHLSVLATAGTPPAPAPLGSSHLLLPTIVAAQKPTAKQIM